MPLSELEDGVLESIESEKFCSESLWWIA
jgi:hypothetical protein